jgi:hypothetical protein
MKVEGGCHCGAITYEAEAEPGRVAVCHCEDCQTLTGSAFRANIQVPAESFRLLTGEPKRYVKIADSGARRVHAFCGDCGAPIFACAEMDPPNYSLRLGALKQRYELGPPARQIWTRRRLPWVVAMADVPALEGQP